MVMNSPPPPPPSIGLAKEADVSDLGKERELRQLRQRVEQLSEENARLAGIKQPLLAIAKLTPHSTQPCRFHTHVLIDEETPHVKCADCGTELEAWTVLLEYAERERRFAWDIAANQQALEEIKHEVELLTRQRNNLRAQIRRRGERPVDGGRYSGDKRKAKLEQQIAAEGLGNEPEAGEGAT